jgi:glycosyltransferase involved in cell wall biosynthesis
MRIGVNTRFLLEGKLEGIGWFTHEVFQRVTAMMPEVEFVFFFDRPPANQFIYGKNVKAVVLSPQARHPLLWYIWFEHSIPKALQQHKIDLFISPDGYLSLKTNVPTIITIHDLAFYHFKEHVPYLVQQYYNWFTPKFAKKAAHIITVSNFSKQDIVERYSIAESNITVVGNGCNKEITALDKVQIEQVRKQYSNELPYFVYVGAIHPRKNIAGLLAAFDAFKTQEKSNTKLILVGRMAWKTSEIKRVLANMKHAEDVIQLGHLERTELSKVLGGALALVYPSFFEGFGIPLLEAMYAEIPVITSNASSLPEVAGDAAILVDPNQKSALVEALKMISVDENLRADLIQKGRQQREKFSWEKTAEKVVEIIREEIKKGSNSSSYSLF